MVLSMMQIHDELVAAGMPDAQARAMVRAFERQWDELATKRDLENLETRFNDRLERVQWWIVACMFGIVGTATGIIIGAMAALS